MTEEEILEIIDNLLPDTTPERIKANRSFKATLPSGVTKKGSPILGYSVKGTSGLNSKDKGLNDLIYEYKHYFDKGYLAPHLIDDLPDLIRKKCEDIINKRT